jgi:hypothetical protein
MENQENVFYNSEVRNSNGTQSSALNNEKSPAPDNEKERARRTLEHLAASARTYPQGTNQRQDDSPSQTSDPDGKAKPISAEFLLAAARANLEENKQLAMDIAISRECDERMGGGTAPVTLTLFSRLAHLLENDPGTRARVEGWIEAHFLEEESKVKMLNQLKKKTG